MSIVHIARQGAECCVRCYKLAYILHTTWHCYVYLVNSLRLVQVWPQHTGVLSGTVCSGVFPVISRQVYLAGPLFAEALRCWSGLLTAAGKWCLLQQCMSVLERLNLCCTSLALHGMNEMLACSNCSDLSLKGLGFCDSSVFHRALATSFQ